MGTLTHFARNLRLPLKIEHAARLIAEGIAKGPGGARRVDVGEVNGPNDE